MRAYMYVCSLMLYLTEKNSSLLFTTGFLLCQYDSVKYVNWKEEYNTVVVLKQVAKNE